MQDSERFIVQQSVKSFLRHYLPGSGIRRILAAVSGGPDSMVMLDVLHQLQKELSFELRFCHVNHNLRGKESYEDESFVISIAEKYDVPLTVRRFDLEEAEKVRQGNLEENARNLRYQKLVHTAIEFDCTHIATGHTMSDQAETVLFRVIRASGISGLKGILPIRTDLEVPVIRPMLGVTREQVLHYLNVSNLPCRMDSMNEDLHYSRNRIRKTLIPLIREDLNPAIEQSLSHLAEVAREEESFWEVHLAQWMERFGDATAEHPADRIKFLHLSTAEQRRIFRVYSQLYDIEPTWFQTEEALKLLQGSRPQGEIHLSEEYRFYRRYDDFFFSPPNAPGANLIEQKIHVPGEFRIEALGIEVYTDLRPVNMLSLKVRDSKIAQYDVKKIKQPIVLRTRLEGDTIHPLGLNGRKKVKKILQEKKITLEERDRVPILCFGDEIAWVVGYCVSESFCVDFSTEQVLHIEVKHLG